MSTVRPHPLVSESRGAELSEDQNDLIEYLIDLQGHLPDKLLKAVKKIGVIYLSGYFSLARVGTRKLRDESMDPGDYTGDMVVFLRTPKVSFAYNPDTGEEISSTRTRYKIDDKNLFAEWIKMMQEDSTNLRAEGKIDLADSQDYFLKILEMSEARKKIKAV